MRCYAAAEIEAALRDHGHVAVASTAYHRIWSKGGGVVTLPIPDHAGHYDADLLDQCIADQWIPIRGSLTAFPC